MADLTQVASFDCSGTRLAFNFHIRRYNLEECLTMSRLTRCERGGWSIPVPWDRAEVLQRALSRRGVASALRLDVLQRAAFLDLPPGVAPEKALLALIGSCSRRASAPRKAA